MKERIKKLRKSLKLTQMEFAERIGVSHSVIANYEIGRRSPAAAAFNNICKEFNVREEWLRDGTGEMFREKSEDEELEEAINRIFSSKPDAFRRRLFKILARLNEQEWLALEQVAVRIAAEYAPAEPETLQKSSENKKSAAKEQREETEEERRARLHAELDAQLDAEKAASEKEIALNVAS